MPDRTSGATTSASIAATEASRSRAAARRGGQARPAARPATDTKSAARTVELFELFAASRRELTLTEISESLAAPSSSCYELVRTLQNLGYLYALGPRKGFYPTRLMLRQVERIAEHDPLRKLLERTLEELRDRTGETVVVGTLLDRQVVIVDLLESTHSIRFVPNVGDRWPLHSTAIGKALLSTLTPEQRGKLLGNREYLRETRSTITEPAALERELALIAKRGYSTTLGESIEGLTGVAVPLKIDGALLAVSVAGPSARCDAAVRKTARTLMEVTSRFGRV